jgi:hypothetical protein
MIGSRRHTGSGSFAKPPFIAGPHRKGPSRGWWSGLTSGGRLAVYASAVLIVSLVAVLMISAGDGNGASIKTRGNAYVADSGLAEVAKSVVDSLGTLRQSVFAYRLKVILQKLSKSAPELQRKLAKLSQVVQGDRCQGYLAQVVLLTDAGSGISVPRDPEGIWRYANKLADDYIPVFQKYLAEIQDLRPKLPAIGLQKPLSESGDQLLKSCDLQVEAMNKCIRGLEKLRDCNEMTVGQASELVNDGVAMVRQANTCLSRAGVALSKND